MRQNLLTEQTYPFRRLYGFLIDFRVFFDYIDPNSAECCNDVRLADAVVTVKNNFHSEIPLPETAYLCAHFPLLQKYFNIEKIFLK